MWLPQQPISKERVKEAIFVFETVEHVVCPNGVFKFRTSAKEVAAHDAAISKGFHLGASYVTNQFVTVLLHSVSQTAPVGQPDQAVAALKTLPEDDHRARALVGTVPFCLTEKEIDSYYRTALDKFLFA